MKKRGLIGIVVVIALVVICFLVVKNFQNSANEYETIRDSGDSFEEEEKSLTVSEKEIIQKDEKPILKNLGVSIEPYDSRTGLAGDVIFSKKLLFDDGRVSNDRAFVDFGYKDKYRSNDIGSIEYWFYVPLGTRVVAPVNGVVQVVFFNHTQDWGINIVSYEGSSWIVSFEHVVKVNVKNGDIIHAGDVVAEAAPRGTFNNEIAMTELAVWHAGAHIIKYCPYEFLDTSLQPLYKNKITTLAEDWETFIGKEVYQQEKWVSPGCSVYSIQET